MINKKIIIYGGLTVVLILFLAGCYYVALREVKQFITEESNRQIVSYFQEHKEELKGERGEQGPSGEQGPAGKEGVVGATGRAGSTGKSGNDGSAGKNGSNGCTWLGFSSVWPYRDLGFTC